MAAWKAWGVSITEDLKGKVFCAWTQVDELLRCFSVFVCYDPMILCHQMVWPNPLWHNATEKKAERHKCRDYGKLSLWHLWLSLCWKIKLFSLQRNSKSWMHMQQIKKTLASSWLYCYFWSLILATSLSNWALLFSRLLGTYLSQCNFAICFYLSRDFHSF